MNVLAIETSCDETAAAVVRDGKRVLSNIVSSQVKLHGPYGGVVPEIAARSHVEALPSVLKAALEEAEVAWEDVDVLAVTYGPGLASSLLVGVAAAKGLALTLDKPLVAVNHLRAHIYSAFLADDAPALADACPFVALIVSGGHTSIVDVPAPGQYVLMGQTIDDAAGEAFDKGANLLHLGYPGGPVIDRVARDGDPSAVRFPRGRPSKMGPRGTGTLDPALCFSFSGLKTALLYHLRDSPVGKDAAEIPSLAASYQEAIVDALVGRCARACSHRRTLVVGGGVSLNSRLRNRLGRLAEEDGLRLLMAPPRFCGDNAAMIGGLAGSGLCQPLQDPLALDIDPNAPVAPGA